MLSGAPRARAPQGNPENKILQVSVFSRVPRERLSLVRAGLRPAQFLLVLFLQFEACVFASLMPPPPPKRHEGRARGDEGIPSSPFRRAMKVTESPPSSTLIKETPGGTLWGVTP